MTSLMKFLANLFWNKAKLSGICQFEAFDFILTASATGGNKHCNAHIFLFNTVDYKVDKGH